VRRIIFYKNQILNRKIPGYLTRLLGIWEKIIPLLFF